MIQDEKINWDRPEPPILLSPAEIDHLLSRWLDGRRVTGVTLLTGGLMNRNFRIHLDGSQGAYVLRLYDRDAAACGRETAVLELVRREVPVPEVLYVEPAANDEHPAFAVMSYVNGISLRALRATGDADAVNDVCFDAGRLLVRLARHRFPASGPLSATLGVGTSFTDGPITTTTLVERFVSAAPFERRVDRDARERMVRFARDHEDRLAELAGEASLVHGDFNSPNVFAQEVNGRWHVAAILDWEFALAASPYCDIGNFLRYHRRARPRYEPHFSSGLVDGGMTLPNDWLAVARLVDMPAMCELLARENIPEVVVEEVRELLIATIEERDV